MPVRLWTELTTVDLADGRLAGAVALLPVAAVEQHGPHLPLGTDTLICDGVIDAAQARLADDPAQILRLPTQPVGFSPEHLGFPGTLSLDPGILLNLWTALAGGVARAGIRRLVVFNTHGGQEGLVQALGADLRHRHGMIVAYASRGGFGRPDGLIDADEAADGLHGGQVETSILLHLAPELVRGDQLRPFPSYARSWRDQYRWLATGPRVGRSWAAQDLNPAGVVGDAGRANARIGRALIDHAADGLAQLLRETASVPLPPG